MSRIQNTFKNLKQNNQKAFGIFLTAGDPDFETSINIIEQLPDNGVDFIEKGMPISIKSTPLSGNCSMIFIDVSKSGSPAVKKIPKAF